MLRRFRFRFRRMVRDTRADLLVRDLSATLSFSPYIYPPARIPAVDGASASFAPVPLDGHGKHPSALFVVVVKRSTYICLVVAVRVCEGSATGSAIGLLRSGTHPLVVRSLLPPWRKTPHSVRRSIRRRSEGSQSEPRRTRVLSTPARRPAGRPVTVPVRYVF